MIKLFSQLQLDCEVTRSLMIRGTDCMLCSFKVYLGFDINKQNYSLINFIPVSLTP